jgi:hypothetical protein
MEEISLVACEINKGAAKINVSDAALYINRLAGKLKIHMLEEDKYLYPELLTCSDPEIRMITTKYISEMGDLAEQYIQFKNKYNVGSKIAANMEVFLGDTRKILDALTGRMKKEDKGLYQLIKDKNL